MEKLSDIQFQTIDWQVVDKTVHPGKTGTSSWQTMQFGGLRIRLVDYSKGYIADHWCSKGHFVHCLEGRFDSELQKGDMFTLTKGMSYIVSDERSMHRSSTEDGAKLLIVDGDFLARR